MTGPTGHNLLTRTAEDRIESSVSQKDSRYNQVGSVWEHTRESLRNISEQWSVDKIKLARERPRGSYMDIQKILRATRELHYSKLGSERRETEYRSGGVTLSPINPLASSNQANRTTAPRQRAHFFKIY
jgi:hypothetical protein